MGSSANAPGSEAGGASTGTPITGEMKVGLLVTGPVSDGGWNQIAYQGLQRIEKELGAKISHQLTEKAEEFEEGFRGYARQGYHLVFGHGDEFSDAAQRVAPEFPKTIFVTTGGRTVLPNAAPIRLAMEEATYLLGILAAGVSKTGKAGQIGGTELPPVKKAFDAFEAGAKSVNPSFEVTTAYVGSWTNANAAKELALARIREGADILFQNADAAGLGVFQAVQENKAKGVYTFGANKNQNDLAPDVILASAVLDVPAAFFQVAEQVKAGTFRGEPLHFGMKEGVVSLVYNPRLETKIPAEVRQKVQAAQDAIKAGTLDVAPGS
jgi:basic membrane lipoprotein Med (substrate-binding protein (PBP1-ABC) superfamily)